MLSFFLDVFSNYLNKSVAFPFRTPRKVSQTCALSLQYFNVPSAGLTPYPQLELPVVPAAAFVEAQIIIRFAAYN